MKTVILSALTLLLGCATPYQPSGFGGGYSETILSPDTFRVYFRGNGYAGTERVQDLVLLRAAEVTEKLGFHYFVVFQENNTRLAVPYATPSHTEVFTQGTDTSSHTSIYHSPSQTGYIFKPRSAMAVKCFADKPEKVFSYDALFLETSLRAKYHIQPASSKRLD